ncbi:C80 family cysteine peptidase [Roseateles sp.]|uniref:C80 family cysteine peptidase n=1 Tax=Roseateles sp. TaxID=1971397 RepID=UPI002F40B3ED
MPDKTTGDALHVVLPTLTPTPTPPDAADAGPSTSPPAAQASTPSRETRIKSFLNLRPSFDLPRVHPEEGRLRVILYAVHAAMRPLRTDAPRVASGQRALLRKAVLAHLTQQLGEALLDEADTAFLGRYARRLVSAVLDGDYAGLAGNAGRADTIRQVILERQSLHDAVLMRPWGIGDLSDNGVEAAPTFLRGEKVAVHRGSALLVEGLLAAAYHAERLLDRSTTPLALARQVGAARQAAYTLASGLAGRPLLFDLDRLDRLAARSDASAQGHLAATRHLWQTQSGLSELGVAGPPTFLSRSERGNVTWHPTGRRLLRTEDSQPFVQLIGLARAPSGSAETPPATATPLAEDVPLPLLRSLMPEVRQRLDRGIGEVTLATRGQPLLLVLHLPPLEPPGKAEQRFEQDKHLARLDAFSATVLVDEAPMSRQLLPTLITLTEEQFLVGTLPVVERQPDGRWTSDADAVEVVRTVHGADGAVRPDHDTPLPDWQTPRRGRPRDTAPDARSDRVRLYLQMEDDEVMHTVGSALTRTHPDEVVWVQTHPTGTFRVIRGQSLLDNAPADARIKLIVSGHGHTSLLTRERLLSGRTARGLAEELKRLIPRLRRQPLPKIERISLLSCALETPVVERSFGREFAAAARDLGPVGMETTLYAQTLVVDTHSGHLVKATQPHDDAPLRQGAAGTTWVFRSDPVTGVTSVRDRFPNGNEGTDLPVVCCAILAGGPPGPSVRSQGLARADMLARAALRQRFHELAGLYRPAGMHLVPRLALQNAGSGTLTYMRLDGTLQTREVVAPADIRTLRAGLASISTGLDAIRDHRIDITFPDARAKMLDLAQLCLMTRSLAAQDVDGDAYQAALLYLGMTQSWAQVGDDAAQVAAVVQRVAASGETTSMAVLVKSTETLSQALRAVSLLAQAGTITTDIARLIDELHVGDQAGVSRAAAQVALDTSGLMLVALQELANLLGTTLIAALADGLGVPLQGLVIGIAALDRAVKGEASRIDRNLAPLRQIDLGYGEPLRAVSMAEDGRSSKRTVLLPNGWAPMRRIDFVNGSVTFADATVGASSLHRHQLYWQGQHRLHDWWINDGAGNQGLYARHGLELDLWTLMRRDARPVLPQVRLSDALRSPDLVLALMTAPNVEIHFDQYSGSRAGGDFALLGDPLIERMQENSNADFVGDYVSSSSFAKSADQWRIRQKPTLLEVVLDDLPRMLALPQRSDAERIDFVFEDARPLDRRRLQPLDQSQVHVRLIGGGGRYTVAIPPDGTVRNPVRILPSAHTREIWTFLLRDSLIGGGKPMSFLDGGVAGFSIGGQAFHFESLHGAVVQIADPRVPGVRLVLDLERKDASLVLTLPPWSDRLRPAVALDEAIARLTPPDGITGGSASSLFRRRGAGMPSALVQLTSSLASGELLSGMLDPSSGGAILAGAHHLFIWEGRRDGGSPGWKRYALNGGELSFNEARRPVVRYDGGRHFGPVTFTYLMESRRFVRDQLSLTVAGERALRQWLRTHPDWTYTALVRFMTEELAAGLELAGPEGGETQAVQLVDFYYRGATSVRPTAGLLPLGLWARLDQLEQGSPPDAAIAFDADPSLPLALARAGLERFRKCVPDRPRRASPEQVDTRRTATAAEVARAKQWLVLRHSQATGAYGPWSDLHAPEPPLSVQERTRLIALQHRLGTLLGEHAKQGGRSSWIRLGETPAASAALVHALRDAGVEIRIDVGDTASDVRAANRSGPDDFYDVRETSMRLFLRDLTDRIDRDAAAIRQLSGLHPVGPSDTPLQAALTRLADTRAFARRQRAPIPEVPMALLEHVRRAGLTFWRPDSAGQAVHARPGRSGLALPGPARFAGMTLGQVTLTSDGGGAVDDMTLRLWRQQAATQGLLPDAWYARHAAPGSPMEIELRELAAEVLRDRLIRLQDHAEATGRDAVPLDADTVLNRQLFTALLRLMPAASGIKVAGRDTVTPGDVVRFFDHQGTGHYALMRRPDTDLMHLPRDPAALRANPYWAYLGSTHELGQDLRPRLAPEPSGPAVLDPAAYHAWRQDDPTPVLGDVYLYPNPFTGRQELFRLQSVSQQVLPGGRRPYGSFPIDGSSNADWLYLGNAESLSPAELGALAHSPSALTPQAFAVGLLEWWTDRLAGGRGDYRNFRMDTKTFEAMTWGSTMFRLEEDGTLYVGLDDNDATPFQVGGDAEFKALRSQFLSGRETPRWLLIQGNGRMVDLDGAGSSGIPEIVILDELDDAPRRIDLDDSTLQDSELFYEGRDLLIHDTTTGRLVRVRNALKPRTALPFDEEWTTDVQLTQLGGTRRLAWPKLDMSLRLPMLTLQGRTLEATREGLDLLIGGVDQWDRMRVPDVFALENGVVGTTPTGDDEALLRFRTPDGRWQLARLSAPLVAAMAVGASSSRRWRLVPDGERRLGFLEPDDLAASGAGTTEGSVAPAGTDASRQRWSLAGVTLSEAMASVIPAGQLDLSPHWVDANGAFPTSSPITGRPG